MINVNKVLIGGRVGKDAESYTFGGGAKKVSFSVATNKRVKNQEGTWDNVAVWHNVEVWGKAADFAEKIRKGDEVLAEGAIDIKEYTTKQGEKRSQVVVMCYEVQVISRKEDRVGGQSGQTHAPAPMPPQATAGHNREKVHDEGSDPDGLPF